jgi:CrcB protein
MASGRSKPAAPPAARPPRRLPWRWFERPQVPWLTLGVIAAGGIIGALARAGLEMAFPHAAGSFDWTTLGINLAGCGLIGVLMTAITEVWQTHRLTGPFLGVGVLGGFTTFSTYIVDIQRSVNANAVPTALAYLAVTLVGALLAVYAGVIAMRLIAARLIARPHGKERP